MSPRRLFHFPWHTTREIADEVEEELKFHLQMEAEELVAAGMTPAAAREEARRRFGDYEGTRRYCRVADERRERHMRVTERLGELGQNVRYSLRQARKNPGMALVVMITLALGIGANAAIFSVVNGVLINGLPYADASRIMLVYENNTKESQPYGQVAAADFIDWRAQQRSFEHLAAFARGGFSYVATEGPEMLSGTAVTADFFAVLETRPLLGRTFAPGEDAPGAHRVVVLSWPLWQRLFSGDSSIVGRSVMLSGEDHTVIGVLRADFVAPGWESDVISPLDLSELAGDPVRGRKLHFLWGIGRLAGGQSPAAGQADLTTIASRLAAQYPESNAGHLATVRPIRDAVVGDVRPTLLVLMGSAGLVLLLACANVANVIVSRTLTLHREFAIRAALGAGRARIVRQLLTESILLAVVGGALGIAVAYWGVRALLALDPGTIPLADRVSVDGRVLLFAIGLSLATGVLFGLAPALTGSKPELSEALKEGGRTSSSGGRRHRLRGTLVVVQTGLAVILLIGAGLLIRTLHELQRVRLGFNPTHLLTFQVIASGSRYDSGDRIRGFYAALLDRLRALPGVEGVATGSALPLIGGATASIVIEGRPQTGGVPPEVGYFSVSPEYFRTLQVPFRAGRDIGPHDTKQTPRVVVINESLAHRYWAGESPIGARFKLGPDPAEPWNEVIGVVGDVKQYGRQLDVKPGAFVSQAQDTWSFQNVLVRTNGDPRLLEPAVREAARAIDPTLPLFELRTMEEIAAHDMARSRFSMLLLSVFGAVALVLSAVGVYGVLAYAVSERRHEYGIRMALGAERGNVLALVLRQGLRAATVGIVVGLAAALAATHLLAGLLYGVRPVDPLTFATVAVLFLLVAMLACYVPARRATRVDAMVALRSD